MALRRDYAFKSAEDVTDLAKLVVDSCLPNSFFGSIKPQVETLETLNDILASSILPRSQRDHAVNAAMMDAKADVIDQLDVVRKLADVICNGVLEKENLTGFTPTKQDRTRHTFIAAAIVAGVSPTKVKGMVEIELSYTVPDNIGYEVHYVLDGVDFIAGVTSLRSRTMKMTCRNFPSLKSVDVYLITLGRNRLRSVPSNTVPGSAI